MARIGWRAVIQCSVGSIALELLTFVCLRLRPDVATAVCISLIMSFCRSEPAYWYGQLLFHRSWPFGVLLCSTILSFRVNDPTEAAPSLLS